MTARTVTRLIVNADDLGRSVGINDGIFAAHRDGIVTSATLMVGFPAAHDAGSRLSEYPDLGVGLHVTLSGARPTLSPDRLSSLVDEQGLLPRRPEDPAGAIFETAAFAEVLAEVEHQVELFHRLTGSGPTHLDSHHHSHRRPVVLQAMIQVAKGLGIPVRNASSRVEEGLRASQVPTTDHFEDRFYGEGVSIEGLLDILTNLQAGTTELMCHPGLSDDALRRESAYADRRERELEVLSSAAVRDAIVRQGIQLGSFRGLEDPEWG
jgi:hypothetical protein